MPLLEEKIKFVEKWVRNKEGVKFSLKDREWVRDEFWLPADGFKLWPKEGVEHCKDCLEHSTDLIEHPDDNPTRKCKECGGLAAEPIIITIINIPRQDGKTFAVLGYCLATIFKGKNKSFAFLANSEDQAKTLFEENYKEAIEKENQLDKRCKITGLKIRAHKTKSIFEALPASAKSVTGRTRTNILIDEARDIEARIITALLPAIFNMHGLECSNGCVQYSSADVAEMITPRKTCPVCKQRLMPWFGRIIITSSCGVKSDSERDWLYELIEEIRERPRPNVHLFTSEESLSPTKSKKIVGVVEDVFGNLPSCRDYIEAEIGNRPVTKGEDFISKADVNRVVDSRLVNMTGTGDRCVSFLDTSISGDATSLVILAEDTEVSVKPWDRIYMARLDVWEPKDQPDKVIDEDAIYDHLVKYLVLFPNLKSFGIDTRAMKWAIRLHKRIKQGRLPWSGITRDWNKHELETQQGWGVLKTCISQGTIRLIENKKMRREFQGVKLKHSESGPSKVVDKNRNKSHKDITENLATCCFLVSEQRLIRGNNELKRTLKDDSPMGQLLDRIYASPTRGLDTNSF